jgi:alpha-galactosidase
MSPETLAILTNRDVIAVDQDPLGKQGERIAASKATEVWMKPLKGGAVAVGLFNRGGDETTVTLHFADLGVHATAKVRDLWAGRDLGVLHGSYTARVPRHGVVMLKLQP